ncbi:MULTISPECIES: hypothetical protein [Cupriavidus]|uniref:Conserved hypothetical signal peptide protein n=1 Tax=Cupriavidus pinatubonensis (strain JMP 134 / LMG 1197) TaxID=264198 RepID=Q46Q48_CUPPJ|nr:MULTISPECIES: hypothetical protein [Cupriavidus]QYY27647.1 hypothetical protein K2O51_06760 [Cupriavidus pinatubonensis]
MRPIRSAVTVLTTALLAWPFAQAQADPVADAASAATQASGAGAIGSGMGSEAVAKTDLSASGQRNPFGSAVAAVASDKLDGVRGGTEVVVNDMRLHGTVADNAVVNPITGTNLISDGAFANAAGLPTAIQNSGNSVLIQNATIINVQFK